MKASSLGPRPHGTTRSAKSHNKTVSVVSNDTKNATTSAGTIYIQNKIEKSEKGSKKHSRKESKGKKRTQTGSEGPKKQKIEKENKGDAPLTIKDLAINESKSTKSTHRTSGLKEARRNANKSLDKELKDQQHLLKSFLTNMQSPKSQINTNRIS